MADRATAPMDMLRKCRGHFAYEAEQFRSIEKIAPTIGARQAAAQHASANEKLVSDIDATLRDWA
jgi:hypothetical protein